MPPAAKPGFYAVAKGRRPGIYISWDECRTQVLNYNGAKYKKFVDLKDAESWMDINVGPDVARQAMVDFLTSNTAFQKSPPSPSAEAIVPSSTPPLNRPPSAIQADNTAIAHRSTGPHVVYCDGACRGNGRSGSVAGVGVWWGQDDPRNICERCPGSQTNNRAELIAIIRILETAPMDERPLVIKTDSRYSISCLTSWLPAWKRNGWRNNKGDPVANTSLIKYADIMLEERRDYAQQPVEFVKVLGHSGEEGNEAADRLANLGATMPATPDRDWEDLIRQVRARMSLTSPPRVATPERPSDPVVASRPSLAPAVAGVADGSGAEPMVRKSSSSSTRNRQDEVVKSETRSPPHVAHAKPDADVSPEELELYADCILTEEEFLHEAKDEGIY
ncbi:ribonuclease H-like domain-containing protein [Trametes punicea]|nr:ribonuclease H-like domain-containing protein [Trametes punicea]